MATQEQANAIADQLQKAFDEITGKVSELTQEIKTLQDAQAAGQDINLSRAATLAQELDDVVPDAPQVIPAEPPAETSETGEGQDTPPAADGSDTVDAGEGSDGQAE